MNPDSLKAPRLDVDFSDRAVMQDPFSMFEEVRAAGRVVWNELAQAWMVPGYEDCDAIRLDTRGERFAVPGALRPDVFFWFEAPAISNTEGATHRRLRGGLARYFTPTAMKETWEARVRAAVDELVTPLAERERFELEDLTKIPVVVVGELLGIPEERHEDFRHWNNVLVSNIAFGNEPPEARRAMDDVVGAAKAYLTEEVKRHRRERPDDLLTVMIDLPDWSEGEIRSVALNLLLAGYDTTARLIGLILVALQDHPDQRRLVAENAELIPSAIEEVMRWLGPTQAIVRVVVKDTELAGRKFTTGEVVYPMVGAANRDPARWPDPQRFDILREYKPNLGFGSGVHVCIGAALARLETTIALEALLRVAPEYHFRDIDYGHGFFARGPEHGIIEIRKTLPRSSCSTLAKRGAPISPTPTQSSAKSSPKAQSGADAGTVES